MSASSFVLSFGRRRAAALVIFALTASVPAHAQSTSASDVATAESLFEQAKELMTAGEYARACAAFQASQDLDPTVGTLLNLARCFDKAGLTASAWSTFSKAKVVAMHEGQSERAAFADAEANRLKPLVPQVVLSVREMAADTVVMLDGKVLPHGGLGLALALDPGFHRVSITEPGFQAMRHELEVKAIPMGQTAAPLVLELGPLAPERAPERAAPEAPEAQPTVTLVPETTPAPGGPSTWEWVGIATAAVGVVAVGVGIGMGVSAVSAADGADCRPSTLVCSAAGLQTRVDAQGLLGAAYAVGIAGGVIGLGGAALWLFGPEDSRTEMALRVHLPHSGFTGVSLGGTF